LPDFGTSIFISGVSVCDNIVEQCRSRSRLVVLAAGRCYNDESDNDEPSEAEKGLVLLFLLLPLKYIRG
jgi:hypothetical protein